MSSNEVNFFGKKGNINLNNLKGGLKKTDLNGDTKLESIFDKIDADKNGILSDSEVNNLFNSLDNKSYINSEGKSVKGNKDGFLDKKEAEFFLKDQFGKDEVRGFMDSFGTLLNMINGKSDTVESSTTSASGNTTIISKGDSEGSDGIKEEYDAKGNLLSKTYTDENGTKIVEEYQDGHLYTKTETDANNVETVTEYTGDDSNKITKKLFIIQIVQ